MFSKSILGIVLIILVGFFLFFLIGQDRDSKEINSSVIEGTQESQSEENFSDRIENFSTQEFDKDYRLSRLIESESYINYKDKPGLMKNPKVTSFGESSDIVDYVLTADEGLYLDSGDFLFTGSVNVESKTGIKHIMKSDSILYKKDSEEIISQDEVTYFGQNDVMVAEGMHMNPNTDNMKMTGKTKINRDTGGEILSKDVTIDKTKNKNIYHSKEKTTYISEKDRVESDGFNYIENDGVMTLLGDSRITQDKGATIDSTNLVIESSNNQERYKTDDYIFYKSQISKIKSKGMDYDAKSQKVELFNGVEGVYE
ncbi:MAG: LPS export ABC transporter periplasmic protein LptC [Gammaproteobacteria bacterium]|jgi:LPS export ABC transporter protein LptC